MLLRALGWVRAKVAQKAERFLLRILAVGPIPKHVAFVMDGNRRYARSHHQHINEGHSEGFLALRRMLEACLRLEIRCVSAYAFALDNFRRSPEEIEHLMNLAHDKLMEMSRHGEILEEYGVRLNVLGKTSLLPEYVQEAIRHVESVTRNNNKAVLNICMSYSSQDEITTAVNSAIHLSLGKSRPVICEDDIDAQLFTTRAGSPPLDILIRTSGVKRLSDFLLWQCSENTQIHFTKGYWPEFGLWDFVPVILDYQRKIWSRRL
ncbi:Decaprenyl diphosphate synthase-like protein [Mycena galopus ATCC 62051]|nr:Decaprenyl diphosphate synthase-like protein [Mycena galopus ATCC 62051]